MSVDWKPMNTILIVNGTVLAPVMDVVADGVPLYAA